METMNVALSPALKKFVQQRVDDGAYSSVSEYIRELIRNDQRQAAKGVIEQELLKGINSGAARKMTAKDWTVLRGKVTKKTARRSSRRS